MHVELAQCGLLQKHHIPELMLQTTELTSSQCPIVFIHIHKHADFDNTCIIVKNTASCFKSIDSFPVTALKCSKQAKDRTRKEAPRTTALSNIELYISVKQAHIV